MKLVVLSGLPGSGKSTLAKEFESKGFQLVSRDKLRKQRPDLVAEKLTMLTVAIVNIMLRAFKVELLIQGKQGIVVDGCHLHPHDKIRFETIAYLNEIELIWTVVDTDIEECIKRDAARSEPVGEQRIRQMNTEWKQREAISV